MAKQKRVLKQSTKSDFITYAMLAVAFIVVEVLTFTGNISSLLSGLLVPLCAYSILAVSLNLVVGILGDLSLGHAGFMCIGAYVSAFFSVTCADAIPQTWLRFLIAILLGGTVAGIFGFLIGIPVLRLKGDYLAIVTLAFGEIIKNIVNLLFVGIDENGLHVSLESANALNLTENGKVIIKGALGITGTPRDANFVIGFILLVITVFVALNLINSRTGRAAMSIRDNRIAAESVGINVTKYKLIVFSVSAFFAGIAGVLYAHNLSSLMATTKNFGYNMSIMILVFVVLGGIGSTRGSIIAAVILTALPEVLRGLNDYRMLIYAIVLILLMLANNNEKLNAYKEKISITNLFKNKKAGNTLNKEANS